MILYLAMLSAVFNEDWITAWLIFIVLMSHMLEGLTKM